MDLFTKCINHLDWANFNGGGDMEIYELCMYYTGDFKIYPNEIEILKNYFLKN